MTSNNQRSPMGVMIESIDKMKLYASGMDVDSFCSDRMTVDACLFRLRMFWSAANAILGPTKALPANFPERIAAFRHLTIEECMAADPSSVWLAVSETTDPVPIFLNFHS